MAAAYDTYDYPSYWEGREYEHECEVVAIRAFLKRVPKIKKVLDIGGGYGRLTPIYAFRAKKIFLSDPSARLLKHARSMLSQAKQTENKDINFIQSTVDNLPKQLKKNKFDLILMVRVMHHLTDPDLVFDTVSGLLNPGGYFIFEYANKLHWKAITKNMLHGNFTYPIDIFPSDKSTTDNVLPFLNYHPEVIEEKLKKHKFSIIETRSVSNVRSPILKKHIPISILVGIDKFVQTSFAPIKFGPSIFILCRKKT